MSTTQIPLSNTPLTKDDFLSDQMVKWCPGCGGHAILNSVAQTFARAGFRQENYMMVSGIGCSSRIPYYLNTYGFHGIHGRAAAIASGIKIVRPDLSVWVSSGDGDSMAIGGNHFIHLVRRNLDITVLLFNNQIYGLTKGQYSPTTPMGKITKTSPFGTIEHPFNPGELVLGSQGTFFARVADNSPKQMTEVMYAASQHKGTAIIEILENCVIFADKAHARITSRETRDDNQLWLEHGKPMLFGAEMKKGIRLNGTTLEVVTLGENGVTLQDILVHDQHTDDPALHLLLAEMKAPVAMGVLRSVEAPTYEDLLEEQIATQHTSHPVQSIEDVMNSGDVFDI
jgi:2-oxoglutarate ferredoxin oxidoreductase subunit beta